MTEVLNLKTKGYALYAQSKGMPDTIPQNATATTGEVKQKHMACRKTDCTRPAGETIPWQTQYAIIVRALTLKYGHAPRSGAIMRRNPFVSDLQTDLNFDCVCAQS